MLTRTPTQELHETQLNEEAHEVVDDLVAKYGPDMAFVARMAFYAGYEQGSRDMHRKMDVLVKHIRDQDSVIRSFGSAS